MNAYLDFVRKKWGQNGLTQCKEYAGVSNLEILEKEFYPAQHQVTILKWIGETKGPDCVRQAGNHSVKNLGLLKYIVRFASITTILNKAPRQYSDAFKYGKMEVIEHNSNRAILRATDQAFIPENCLGWIGAFEAMMELTNTKGTVKEIKCQLDGNSYCEYELSWE